MARTRKGPFADPGYQPDRKPRYQLDTVKHIHAAWAYLMKNEPMYLRRHLYTPEQLRLMHLRIQRAGKQKGIVFGHASAAQPRDPHGPRTLRIPKMTREGRGSSIKARWAEVRAAERAGHPISHPRRYVFGDR